MTKWTMRAATEADLDSVVELLNEAANSLASQGISQWSPGWMTIGRMRPMIHRGETWVAHDANGYLVSTVSLSPTADGDFWTVEEQKIPALYLNKLASRRPGAGAWAIKWALRYAGTLGYGVVRLDAWATNRKLHEYYRRQGWNHLRTMHLPGRQSGALFEKATRRPVMIVESTTRVHALESSEAISHGPEVILEVLDTAVSGVPPFLMEEHPLSLTLGSVRPVWHDGTTWRVGIPGWGDSYAEHVVRWPVLNPLTTDVRYILVAPQDAIESITLTAVEKPGQS